MRPTPRPDPEVLRARLRRVAGLDPPEAPDHHAEPTRPTGRMLAVAAVVAVLVAGWLTWQAGGDTAATVVTGSVDISPSPPVSTPAVAASTAAEVVVQVVGAVRRPGVVRLPAGSRVQDAVAAAGGVRPGRSSGAVNLARRLVDGEQIVVGAKSVPGGAADPGVPGAPGVTTGAVDLNLADATVLDTLPGVGPVTAAAILRWRDEHGGFTSVEQLQEVDGIGPKTYAQLAPLVVAGS